MLAELQELTQSERAEVSAVAFGLIFAVAVGFCIVCAYLFNAMVKRSPYDETSGKRHPADDVHLPDDEWPLLERWARDNPEKVDQILKGERI